jgi:gluconate 2-dehydrogenase subunit 3-like protein
VESGLNRRDVIRILTASAVTALQLPAAEPNAPLFFTKEEYALLATLPDLIIPTDDHSPGAQEAGVAAYIDRSVAEAIAAEDKTSWRKGLSAINDLSQETYHAKFLKLEKPQQTALLTKLAAAEKNPQAEPEKFFTQVKQTTAFAYYSSSIGIHQEINYKGNVILEQFVGYDAT